MPRIEPVCDARMPSIWAIHPLPALTNLCLVKIVNSRPFNDLFVWGEGLIWLHEKSYHVFKIIRYQIGGQRKRWKAKLRMPTRLKAASRLEPVSAATLGHSGPMVNNYRDHLATSGVRQTKLCSNNLKTQICLTENLFLLPCGERLIKKVF